jgi:hypothetical protein
MPGDLTQDQALLRDPMALMRRSGAGIGLVYMGVVDVLKYYSGQARAAGERLGDALLGGNPEAISAGWDRGFTTYYSIKSRILEPYNRSGSRAWLESHDSGYGISLVTKELEDRLSDLYSKLQKVPVVDDAKNKRDEVVKALLYWTKTSEEWTAKFDEAKGVDAERASEARDRLIVLDAEIERILRKLSAHPEAQAPTVEAAASSLRAAQRELRSRLSGPGLLMSAFAQSDAIKIDDGDKIESPAAGGGTALFLALPIAGGIAWLLFRKGRR